jgi:hypothetical protein
MDTQTPYFLRHEKFKLIQNFDGSYSIIEITKKDWVPVLGPYMTPEEAFPDMRNLINETGDNL